MQDAPGERGWSRETLTAALPRLPLTRRFPAWLLVRHPSSFYSNPEEVRLLRVRWYFHQQSYDWGMAPFFLFQRFCGGVPGLSNCASFKAMPSMSQRHSSLSILDLGKAEANPKQCRLFYTMCISTRKRPSSLTDIGCQQSHDMLHLNVISVLWDLKLLNFCALIIADIDSAAIC